MTTEEFFLAIGVFPQFAKLYADDSENVYELPDTDHEQMRYADYKLGFISHLNEQSISVWEGSSRLRLISEDKGILVTNYVVRDVDDELGAYLAGEVTCPVQYSIKDRTLKVDGQANVYCELNYYENDENIGWVNEEIESWFSEHNIIDCQKLYQYIESAFIVMVGKDSIISNDIFVQ